MNLDSPYTLAQVAAALAPYVEQTLYWICQQPEGEVRMVDELCYEHLPHLESYPGLTLFLRPLLSITDEEAREVARLLGFTARSTQPVEQHSDMLFVMFAGVARVGIGYYDSTITPYNDDGDPDQHTLTLVAFDYLRSRGYDLPAYSLGGKTLKETGLAVYEVENTPA